MAAEPSTPAEKHAPAGFEPAPCWFMLAPDQVEGETVRCGYVAVPERHAQQLGMFNTCAQWPSGAADPSWYEPVVSRVPTLLSGDFDPVTPPELGSAAERTLERGLHVVIAGGAHAVLDTNTCAADIAREFLRKPTVRPDTSCAATSRIGFLVEPPASGRRGETHVTPGASRSFYDHRGMERPCPGCPHQRNRRETAPCPRPKFVQLP